MSCYIFEVLGAKLPENRFIYTVPDTNGTVYPYSALTLTKVIVPVGAEFRRVQNSLKLRDDSLQIQPEDGQPFIVVDDLPTLIWLTDVLPLVKKYPIKLPKQLMTSGDVNQLDSMDLSQNLSEFRSPDPEASPDNLTNQVEFLTKVVETLLRRQYELYNGLTCPEKLPTEGKEVEVVPFSQIQELIKAGKIKEFRLDPMLQPFAGSNRGKNRMLTFVDNDDHFYLVRANYDQTNNKIGQPK